MLVPGIKKNVYQVFAVGEEASTPEYDDILLRQKKGLNIPAIA